jgi:hypothetical protein
MRSLKNYGRLLGMAVLTFSQVAPQVAVAANLTSVQGKILVSRAGGPFQAVSGPTRVNPGDVVRADVGGSAQVVYANGATQVVPSNTMLLVSTDPAAVLSQAAFQGAPGAGAANAAAGTAGAGAAGASAAVSTTAIAIGAATVGAAVVAGVVIAKKKSASP